MHLGGPNEAPRASSGTCSGLEDAGNAREESAIKIEHAQKFLQGFDIGGLWEGKDWLDMGRNRQQAS